MSYFLKNFITQKPTEHDDGDGSQDGTLSNLSFESSYCRRKRLAEESGVRRVYSEVVSKCANIVHKDGVLGPVDNAKDRKLVVDDSYAADVLKNAHVIAPPSLFAANFLAWSETVRISAQYPCLTTPDVNSPSKNGVKRQHFIDRNADLPSAGDNAPAHSNHLVTIGLDSIFSILLELNQRDPELCAQAIQQLLSLLQVIPPEGMIHEPKSVVQRMADLLKKLRIEGNAAVSSASTACLVALAVARGDPDMLFSTVKSLLCDVKANVPFNQLASDANPLPKNFQSMALAVCKSLSGSSADPEYSGFFSTLLTEHEPVSSHDLVFPSNMISSEYSEPSTSQPMASKSCLVSDGSYVYILNYHGFFKMGTGLTETPGGKVTAFSEMLKYREGSSLFICQDSLYLRRKHSSRLWVIDKENLREIGEIMLQASLSEGVLFADGRNFFQGNLDDHWNFVITPLDDSFGALTNQKNRQTTRLVEFGFAVFGAEAVRWQEKLVSVIPPKLQCISMDLQFASDTAFLLTRQGSVFYAGKGASFSLSESATWTELSLPEQIVQMHVDSFSNCLLLRSGSGHLWAVGTLIGALENHGQQQNQNKKYRKIRIPHKRKCTSITGINGAAGYVTDNGKCYLFGRHIVSSNNDSGQVTGLEGFSIASLGVGKTHVVAISKAGLVYTCGMNNVNQCGRDETPLFCPPRQQQPGSHASQPLPGLPRAAPSTSPNRGLSVLSPTAYCYPGEHLFIKDVASICGRCGRCSGKNDKCPTRQANHGIQKVSLQRGMLCVCDAKESVCLRCGICQVCAESENLNRYKPDEQVDAPSATAITTATTTTGQLQPAKLVLQGDIKVATVSCGNYHTVLLCADRSVYTFGSNCHGQLGTGDTDKKSGAFKLPLPSNVQVVQAVAGANHCVLRTLDGQILTFGAHKAGQLLRRQGDTGDAQSKWFAVPAVVEGFGHSSGKIASWISASGDATYVQTQTRIFSRSVLNDARVTANKEYMIIIPLKSGELSNKASDYIVIKRKTHELIQFKSASSQSVKSLSVSGGQVAEGEGDEYLYRVSYGLDPHYPLLWTYTDDTFKVVCYSDKARKRHGAGADPDLTLQQVSNSCISSTDCPESSESSLLKEHKRLLQLTELQIPIESEPEFSDTQLATFLLTNVYSMSVLAAFGGSYSSPATTEEQPGRVEFRKRRQKASSIARGGVWDGEDSGYHVVNRFDGFGGGWGYSAHCVEAVQFKVSKAIFVCGIGLFGGRGEYAARVKLFKVIGNDFEDTCVELLTESDETVFESASRETGVVQLNKNIAVVPDEWHVLLAQIQGPSSDCGASGRPTVKGGDDVEFTFKNSILSNNGTDTEVGQIPEIYYMLRNPDDVDEGVARERPSTQTEQLLISPKTLFQITPDTVSALFCVFEWATKGSFSTPSTEHVEDDVLWRQERSAFIAIVTLRMLRLYISLLSSHQSPDDRSDDELTAAKRTPPPGQLDDFANLIVDFSNILKNIFTVADERYLIQDKIGSLVIEETVEAYTSCADLLLPSAVILKNRLAQAIAKEQRTWSLLALLRACQQLDSFSVPLLLPDKGNLDNADNRHVNLGEKLSRYFCPGQGGSSELSGSGIIRFLFDLGFSMSDRKADDILLPALKKAALELLGTFSKALVANDLKVDAGPPLQATDNRFRRFNSHLNWETGNGAHDAIAFKCDGTGVAVHGVGIFIGQPSAGEFSYELETFVNTGTLADECWSLVDHQVGAVKDSNIGQSPKQAAMSSQKLVTGIRLAKPLALQPDTTYAVRIQLSAGKTFYGENGQTAVKLSNGARLHFLPCSLSRNGTSLVRGQLPYLIYTVDAKAGETRLQKAEEARDKCDFWKTDNETHNLFVEMVRLLAQKLSLLTVTCHDVGLQVKTLCSQLICHATVFLEANPELGFHVISAFDELIPLLTSANADEIKNTETYICSTESRLSASASLDHHGGPGVVQALVESPHPYKPASMLSQTVTFDPPTEFLVIRFHDECQTLSADDVLWIYAAKVDAASGPETYFPVGRYHGSKWPDGQILVPGHRLWFIFEATLPGEGLDPSKMYGFRITVDGYTPKPLNILDDVRMPVHGLLEQQFVWLCSVALKLFIMPPEDAKHVKRTEEKEAQIYELIKRHGSLLRRGLNIDSAPSIQDLVLKRWPETTVSHERTFLDEFIAAELSSAPGRLARALSSHSFVDLTLSTIEVEAAEVSVNRPVRLILCQRDQFNREARCTSIQVEVSIASADDVVANDVNEQDVQNQNSPSRTVHLASPPSGPSTDDQQNLNSQLPKAGRVLADDGFQTLKQLQLREPFRAVHLNKSRYNTMTMMPVYAKFSLEELRLAFQHVSSLKDELKLVYSNNLGHYCVEWRPRRSGRFRIDCTVDGFKLASTTFIEVGDTRAPSSLLMSPRSALETQKQAENLSVRQKIARLDSFSSHIAVRIRTHPSLTAPSVGQISRGCSLTWTQLLKNAEGTWLSLTEDAKQQFCDAQQLSQDAWCLQYHKELETDLLQVNQSDLLSPDRDVHSPTRMYPSRSPKRQLPPLPKPPQKLHSELDEDADVLTVRRQSVTPNSSTISGPHEALGPRLMDTIYSVFAAVIWHELLVHELVACSNHLKNNPQLEHQLADDPAHPALPAAFQPVLRLYRSTVHSVLEVVEQHLILPSPPSARQLASRQRLPSPEELCELCQQLHAKPITVHMRERHPGCRGPCGGHGYNSIGNYTTGWSGLCGDGGQSNAVWYLLCSSCRASYLSKNASNSLQSPPHGEQNDWVQFRQKAASKQFSAESILKENAMFLLELRPSEDKAKVPQSTLPRRPQRFKVDMYPQAAATEPQELLNDDVMVVENEAVASPLHHVSHQSDPGGANELNLHSNDLFSLSASAHLFKHPANPFPLQRPQKLASLHGINELLKHPVLAFCVESHDLQLINKFIKSAIRRSVKFGYAFRIFNWLLKLVTSETTVTDIVWNYLSALGAYSAYNHWLSNDLKLATKLKLLPHPWRLCFLAGPEVNNGMISELHNFLGTLAVIVQSNGVEMGLKCLCFKAWTFQLTVYEQNLLITLCNILSAVGAVLSDAGDNSAFEESALSLLAGLPQTASTATMTAPPRPQKLVKRLSSSHVNALNPFLVRSHENVSFGLQIEPSSRSQLAPCLTDNSLETFWESGDEDKNRSRKLDVFWDDTQYRVELLALYIDNLRDANFKVHHVVVRNQKMSVVFSSDIDWSFVGWVKVLVAHMDGVTVTLKGAENGCRIRQLVAFGQQLAQSLEEARGREQTSRTRQSISQQQLQFSTAQMDAFVLFQSIAAQAFSDELGEDQNGTLRQQVIDMLFNRVQLQPLQSYVCFQMVTAVEREIAVLRDKSKRNYSYVCGLMVMLVKICESRKGLEVFSLRNGLLIVLSELVLFAPAVVQSQAVETLGVLLKHFKTQEAAVFIQNMLAAIGKAITLQIKDKVTRKVTSQKLENTAQQIPDNWKIDKPITLDVAQKLIHFVNRITTSDFGEQWAISVKIELANQIMSLSQLLNSSSMHLPEPTLVEAASKTNSALKSSQFWLSVAALALINDSTWLEMSPALRLLKAKKSKDPDPQCENHDDGHTLAHFKCDICNINLCRECFTILHLNKKKKSHNARLIGGSNLCPKVDVHEGCTRLRISNLLVLFNTSKLSGMVEVSADVGPGNSVPQSSSANNLDTLNSNKCRLCANSLTSESGNMLGICGHEDCVKLAEDACTKILPCGHYCGGIKDEEACLPCFVCERNESKQDADDLCVICFVDRLGAAPCVKLKCGHLFHHKCVKTVLEKRWAGPRIVFRFMHCPLCNEMMEHDALTDLLSPLKNLYSDVSQKARMRLGYDGFPTSEMADPAQIAMDKYVYVLCSKCGKAYFGGESSCQEALESSTDYNPDELLCGGCSDIAGSEICSRHGIDYLEYKCRFCCSVAVYFCFGSTHFCSGCHSDFQKLMPLAKHQLPQCPVGPHCVKLEGTECPLKVEHPATGEEFSLGCGICRNIQTF